MSDYDKHLVQLELDEEERQDKHLEEAALMSCMSCQYLANAISPNTLGMIHICHYGDHPVYVKSDWNCTYLYDEPYPYRLETWRTI